LQIILALAPILLILGLMAGLRWSAAKAGAAGYLATSVIAFLFFGANPILLAYAQSKALFLAFDVLLIIWAAFLFYRISDEAGAIRTIGQALPHLTPDRGMQGLIIGWVFASFLQGVGGFGVPVAVVAPMLVSLGFAPLAAVIIPSVGHSWAVSFGSLGSAFQALLSTTGVPANVLAPPTAGFLAIACVTTGWLACLAIDGWTGFRRLAIPALLLGIAMGGTQYLVAVSGLWNISAFTGGLAGLACAFPLALWLRHRSHAQADFFDRGALLVAISGYLILIAIILGAQLVQPIHDFLNRVYLTLQYPEITSGLGVVTPAQSSRRISLFGHTGILLLYAGIAAYLVYRSAHLYRRGAEKCILSSTVRGVMFPSISILSMVSTSVIMEQTGMTETIARGLAEGVGRFYPLVVPWIGAIGAFMTGSNTNSNVIFANLQMQTAQFLGFSTAIILAGQTAGAALASVIAPSKVVVGTSTTAMAGQEGLVTRKLAWYIIILLALISLLVVGSLSLTG
jgi:lactate permease